MVSRRSALCAVLLLAVGCAGPAKSPSRAPAKSGESEGPFPSVSELEDLAEHPAPDPFPAAPPLDVESWELAGPFPEKVAVESSLGGGPWDSLLADEARRRAGLVVPTEAMRCAAREVGLFHLKNHAEPNQGLRDYITRRCNASVPMFRFAVVHSAIPEVTTESMIFEQWKEPFAARVAEIVRGGPTTAGVWFGRDGEWVVAVVTAGTRRVRLDPVSTIPDADGHIRLTGEMLVPAANVSAVFTRGGLGFGSCLPDSEAMLPRFEFDCALGTNDESARVTLSYTAPGRLLGDAGLNLMFWPQGKPSATYRRPSFTKERRTTNIDAARVEFVAALNDLREDVGLGPLVESEAQSAIASILAPYYFAAVLGVTAETDADLVALGLLAGWNVEGVLQSGHFTTAWIPHTDDVGRLLSEMLSHPIGRSVLLAADADQIAVGAIVDADPESPAMAAVVGTYSVFSESAHAANAERVYDEFQEQRRARGLQDAKRLDEIEPLAVEAAGSVQAGVEPAAILDQLLEASSAVLQRPVVGWIAETSDLDEIVFPDEFLDRSTVAIAVSVSHRQPADQPWGHYVVMLVAAQPAGHRI